MSKLIFTKNKIKLLKSNFSEEDLILSDWLASCPIDLIKLLIERLDKQITNDAITDWFINKFNTKYRTKKIDTEMRILTSTILVHELKEYSGNTLNIITAKPDYPKILDNVYNKICKRYKISRPTVNSIKNKEKLIAELLLKDAINNVSEEDLFAAIKGSNFHPSNENLKKILIETLASGGIGYLANLLGKETVKNVVLNISEKYMLKQLSKKATTEVLSKISKKVAQKTFQSAVAYVGWAFFVKDLFDLAGEASRITVPFVINISIYRTLDNIKTEKVA